MGSDAASFSIMVGNPARTLRKRFGDDLIELLLRVKWWYKSIGEINRLIPILTCGNPEMVEKKERAWQADFSRWKSFLGRKRT